MINLNEFLLKELKLSTGCTEPAAIAFASCFAREKLDTDDINKIKIGLSSNVLKNALCVKIPGTNLQGIELVAMLGILNGNSKDKLLILKNINDTHTQTALKMLNSINVEVNMEKNVDPLYISVELFSLEKHVKAVVEGNHDSIKYYTINGVTHLNDSNVNSGNVMSSDNLSFDSILDFVIKREYDINLIKMAKDYNSSIGEFGLKNECGLNIGRSIKEVSLLSEDYINVVAKTVAGIDARMSGVSKNVIINSGSGNQGITATIPIVEIAKILNVESDIELDALALSHLITLYIRSKQRKLSTACGAVCAASGVAAGIAYMLGGTKSQIEGAVINCLCSSFGMFCDGAKTTCALKVSSCLTTAIMSAMLSAKNIYINENLGVISPSLEETLVSISRIEDNLTGNMDELIMNLCLSNRRQQKLV